MSAETATQTAETRAGNSARDRAEELWRGLPYADTAIPVIAQAIREAEDAALERAAALFDQMMRESAAALCRDLKSSNLKGLEPGK